ncbi:hypothetical protein MRX96_012915 [Rhipicephalus microplus]
MNTDSMATPKKTESPPSLERAAEVQLGETAEAKMRSLSRLRELIAGDTSLLCPTDDTFLVKFLRARKYCEEAAFGNIQKYFRVKQTAADFFKNLSPSTVPLSAVLPHHRLMMVSEKKDPEGRRVAVIKIGSWTTSVCSATDLMRSALVMAEWALLDEETQVRGVVCVFDLKNLHIMHMAHFTPPHSSRKRCTSCRIPFLKSKLLKRIYFVGRDLRKLHGVLPADVIPAEYGGTHEDFDYCRLEKDVKSSSSYFDHISRFGYRTSVLT